MMYVHVFTEFVELINDHNTNEMGSFMTEDHVYINAEGHRITGKEQTLDAWKTLFSFFPDYWIDIRDIAETNTVVLACGTCSGTYTGYISGEPQHFFKIPAAFHAVIENEKIKSWQIFADTKVTGEILKRNQ